MTSNARGGDRILGSLRSADGKGVVRMQDRFNTDINDLWSALTDPRRLARWMGEVEGDLRLGGEFRARFFASGWEGTGRVEACEPTRRLLLVTKGPGERDEQVIEVTLAADGAPTTLVWEERRMPLELLAAYGAGIQVHVEDLAAHLAGRERCDARGAVGRAPPCLSRLGRQPQLALAGAATACRGESHGHDPRGPVAPRGNVVLPLDVGTDEELPRRLLAAAI
jgi:uncharacterized protein YndB with AHSA1/START domain